MLRPVIPQSVRGLELSGLHRSRASQCHIALLHGDSCFTHQSLSFATLTHIGTGDGFLVRFFSHRLGSRFAVGVSRGFRIGPVVFEGRLCRLWGSLTVEGCEELIGCFFDTTPVGRERLCGLSSSTGFRDVALFCLCSGFLKETSCHCALTTAALCGFGLSRQRSRWIAAAE